MNRILMFAIFITIASAVFFGLHLFVYKVIAGGLGLTPNTRKWIKILFWCSGISFILAETLSRMYRIYFLNYYAFVWLGVIAIAFSIFFLSWVAAKFFPSHIRVITLIALGIVGVISLVSLVNGLRKPVVKEISVSIKDLPGELSGFTIVHLSDLHMEEFKAPDHIPYIVDTVNAMKPDLVAITGDLIEDDICKNPWFCEQMRRLNAVHGVVAITGNHEFYAGIENFKEFAKRSNIKILRNESMTVAGSVQIIGLDDNDGRRFGGKGPDLETAMKGCDPTKPMILLYHRPDGFDEAVEKGVDLQLSGHTHAGQIPPMDFLVWLYYKYPAGLFEHNGSYIYTSYATGYWGPPMRFLSRCEIVKITLVSK